MSTCWLVRAGERSRFAQAFLDAGVVALGWTQSDLGDLSGLDRDELIGKLLAAGATGTPGADANELLRFRDAIGVGDVVVTPDARAREIHVGDVIGPYEYRDPSPVGQYRHVRAVRWVGSLARDGLPRTVVRELDYQRTLRRITDQARWRDTADRLRSRPPPP